jgi:nucleoid DNA-binding protein
MTKAEMIEKIAKDAGISKVAAGKAYDSFLKIKKIAELCIFMPS